jgi:serine/threonine protein kinase
MEPMLNSVNQPDNRDERQVRADSWIGKTVGAYTLDSVLGIGGLSAVYASKDEKGTPVAIKLPLDPTISSLEWTAKATLHAGLDHPNIVKVSTLPEPSHVPALVMDLYDGHLEPNAVIPEADIVQLTLQIAEAIKYAHAKDIIHRDIKPSNILRKGKQYALGDFDLAERAGSRITQSVMLSKSIDQTIAGTLPYMSPEAQFGAPPSKADDIFSLSVVLYQLVMKELPGRNISTALKEKNIPDHLQKVIEKGLHDKRDRRYQTIDAFITDLSKKQLVRTSYTTSEPINNTSERLRNDTAAISEALLKLFAEVVRRSQKITLTYRGKIVTAAKTVNRSNEALIQLDNTHLRTFEVTFDDVYATHQTRTLRRGELAHALDATARKDPVGVRQDLDYTLHAVRALFTALELKRKQEELHEFEELTAVEQIVHDNTKAFDEHWQWSPKLKRFTRIVQWPTSWIELKEFCQEQQVSVLSAQEAQLLNSVDERGFFFDDLSITDGNISHEHDTKYPFIFNHPIIGKTSAGELLILGEGAPAKHLRKSRRTLFGDKEVHDYTPALKLPSLDATFHEYNPPPTVSLENASVYTTLCTDVVAQSITANNRITNTLIATASPDKAQLVTEALKDIEPEDFGN